MKKVLMIIFGVLVVAISCVLIVNAEETENKFEYHNESWYLSREEATAFTGFIYNLSPEKLEENEHADTVIDFLSGKYADNPEEEYMIKLAVCEVAITQLNSSVERYDHASIITSENLISFLKTQVGENPSEDYINSTCNRYLDGIKDNIKNVLLICNLSDSEYEIYENIDTYMTGYETIADLPDKIDKYVNSAKACVEASVYVASSSRSAMYKYFLSYVKLRNLADSTIDGFEFAMGYNVFAGVNNGIYDPFLNWAGEDEQKMLNRWAELLYWLTQEIGGTEFTNDDTFGVTSSTCEPVEFVPGSGTHEGNCGENIRWHLDKSTGVLTLYGEGDMYDFTSSFVSGKAPWYAYRNFINRVSVCDGITSIGDYAFSECKVLDTIYIAPDVKTIGDYAFLNCSSMRICAIDSVVNDIGVYAFKNCKNLVFFDIPKSVTEISHGAFYDCVGLVYVNLPENLLKIGDYAFYNCNNLTSVTLSNSVTDIGFYAFYWCNNLNSVILGDSVTRICPEAFYHCEKLTSITIPDSVTYISVGAFEGCKGLKEITIPISAETEEDSFRNCGNIEKITLTKGKGYYATYYTRTPWYNSSVREIVIEDGITNIADETFSGCKNIISITIPDSMTSIGGYAFTGTAIESITLSDNITDIGLNAFGGCDSLKKVYYIGDINNWSRINFEDYDSNPFCYADNLYVNGVLQTEVEITIPEDVTEMKGYAFKGCLWLKSIIIHDNVTGTIGTNTDNAFRGHEGITSVTIGDGITGIHEYAFLDCINLKSVKIGNSVTSIGDRAFQNCTSLTAVTIPDSVTHIGYCAFYDCKNLKELTMPVSTKIYNNQSTFTKCTNIEKVTLTKGTGIMQDFGRENSGSTTETYYTHTPWVISNSSLKEIIIEDGVINIGANAFSNCSKVASVTISDSITNIGKGAFYNCDGLKDVYYTGTEEDWNRIEIGVDNKPLLNATIHFLGEDTGGNDTPIEDETTKVKFDSSLLKPLRGTASIKSYKGTDYIAITMAEGRTMTGIYKEMTDGSTIELVDIVGTIQDRANDYVAYQSQNKTNPVATMKVTYADGTVETYPVVFEHYEMEREIDFDISKNIRPIRGKASLAEDAKGEYILVEMLEGQSSVGVYKATTDGSTTAILLGAEGMHTEQEKLYIFYGSQNTFNPEGRLTVTKADGSQATYRVVFKMYEMDPNVNVAKGLRPVRGAVTFDADGTIRIKMTSGQKSVGLYKTMANGATFEIKDANGKITNNLSSVMFYMTNNTANITATMIFTLPDGSTKEQKIIFDMGLPDRLNPLTDYEYELINSKTSIKITKYFGNYENIVIPESVDGIPVTEIGEFAFYNCKKLKSITIPESITYIGESAFENCINLKEVFYLGDLESWCEADFANETANPLNSAADLYIDNVLLTEISIPEGITEIKPYTFYGCNSLEKLIIPNGVESVGFSAFGNCSSLKNVVLPETLDLFEGRAFINCENIEEVHYGGSLSDWCSITFSAYFLDEVSVAYSANPLCYAKEFYINDLLQEEIIIPNDIETISCGAFFNADFIREIDFSKELESVGNYAFAFCDNIELVRYYGTQPEWELINIGTNNDSILSASLYYQE